MCFYITTRISGLPDAPLDAAAEFHATYLLGIRHNASMQSPDALVLVFEPAGHAHRGWRLAVVQSLARELIPTRVNAIEGRDEAALRDTMDYLEMAPGVTGQLLAVDGNSGGNG